MKIHTQNYFENTSHCKALLSFNTIHIHFIYLSKFHLFTYKCLFIHSHHKCKKSKVKNSFYIKVH